MADFELNTGALTDLGGTVAERSQAYLNNVEEISGIVNALGSIWGGPAYDTFKSTFETDLVNLEELNAVLNDMSGSMETTASEGEKLLNSIESAMGQ